ncbi:hypothetical protein [Aquimarina sp. AU58]|uniref:hypothetical protein n=1 Tax=Aquimarina sp. AU58 TaxID=1874112 RepID=UPI000D6EB041|nr:hypothetical protein [Aquimarina sp. AU58]
MKNLNIEGVTVLSKTAQKSIGGGDISLPDPILTCWQWKWLCDTVGFPPLTGRYCRWVKVRVPCR